MLNVKRSCQRKFSGRKNHNFVINASMKVARAFFKSAVLLCLRNVYYVWVYTMYSYDLSGPITLFFSPQLFSNGTGVWVAWLECDLGITILRDRATVHIKASNHN